MTVETNTHVLIVEDNPMDAQILRIALRRSGLLREATIVDDGGPAIALLNSTQREKLLLPSLVILDLNLKQVDGPEVLAHIRDTENLRNLCVAILSSSPTDVMLAKAAKANCYFTKPNDLDAYLALGEKILSCYSNSQSSATRPKARSGEL